MTRNPVEAKRQFDEAVDHIYVAFRFFLACVPGEGQFHEGHPLRIGRFEFRSPKQAKSIQVELAWAFFTRLEGAYEALTIRLGLSPKTASDRLLASGSFDQEEIDGLAIAREIRNILHHGDGDANLLKNQPKLVISEPGHEPQLSEENIKRFVALFTKAAEILARPQLRVV